jgi:hypothetical protein
MRPIQEALAPERQQTRDSGCEGRRSNSYALPINYFFFS